MCVELSLWLNCSHPFHAEGAQALVKSGAMGRGIVKEEPESPEAQLFVPRDWQRQYVFVAATMPDVGDKSVGAEIGQVS